MTVSRAAIVLVLEDYRRQRETWQAKFIEAQRQIDAVDGAIQACEALIKGIDADAIDSA